MPTPENLRWFMDCAPRLVRWALIRGALLVLLGSCPTLRAAEIVSITNGEWPPFTSEQLPHGGILSRIVTQAFALEGITVRYGYFPWKRAYEYGKSGKWDGSVGWAPTAEHLEDFYFSRPVIFVEKALFHLKSRPFDWKTSTDLQRWRLGATAGYYYGAQWDQAVRIGLLQVEEVATDAVNLHKLLLQRVDAVAMDVEVAEYLMRTQLTPQEAALITHHPRLLAKTPICLALSRQLEKNPDLLARFNRGLERLKESGAYDRYLAEGRASTPASTPRERPPGAAPPDAAALRR